MGTYPYCSGNVSRICDVDLWSCDLQNRELDLGNCVCVCVCVCVHACRLRIFSLVAACCCV